LEEPLKHRRSDPVRNLTKKVALNPHTKDKPLEDPLDETTTHPTTHSVTFEFKKAPTKDLDTRHLVYWEAAGRGRKKIETPKEKAPAKEKGAPAPKREPHFAAPADRTGLQSSKISGRSRSPE